MADDDFSVISGGEPEWALESTQTDILEKIKDILKGKSTKDVEKVLKKIESNIDHLSNENKKGFKDVVDTLRKMGSVDGTTALGAAAVKTKVTEAKKATLFERLIGTKAKSPKGPSETMTQKKSIDQLLGRSTSAMGKVTGGLFSFAKGLHPAIFAITSFASAMAALGAYIRLSVDGYRTLVDTGLTFSGSLIEMRRQSADMGVGFETFTKIMTKYSTIIKGVGTVTFIDLQNRVRTLNKDFGQFGLTTQQISEYTAEYLERQIRSGRFEQLSANRQAREVQNYMYQLTELSKITGRRREDMAKDIKDRTQNARRLTAENILGEEAGKRFRHGLDLMSPAMESVPGFGKALEEVANETVIFGNIAMSTLGRTASVIDRDLLGGLQGFVSGLRESGEGAGEGLSLFFERLDTDKVQEKLADFVRAGDEGAIKLTELSVAYKGMTKKQREDFVERLKMSQGALEQEMKVSQAKRDADQIATDRIMDMQSAWGRVTGMFEKVMLHLAPIFTDFTNIFMDVVDALSPIVLFLFDAASLFFKIVHTFNMFIFRPIYAIFRWFFGVLNPLFKGIGDSLDTTNKWLDDFNNLLDKLSLGAALEEMAKSLDFFEPLGDLGRWLVDLFGDLVSAIRGTIFRLENMLSGGLTMSKEEVEAGIAEEDRLAALEEAREVAEERAETIAKVAASIKELSKKLGFPVPGVVPAGVVPTAAPGITPVNIPSPVAGGRAGRTGPRAVEEVTTTPTEQAAIEQLELSKKLLEATEHQNEVLMGIADSNERTAKSTKKSEGSVFNPMDMMGSGA